MCSVQDIYLIWLLIEKISIMQNLSENMETIIWVELSDSSPFQGYSPLRLSSFYYLNTTLFWMMKLSGNKTHSVMNFAATGPIPRLRNSETRPMFAPRIHNARI